jgi:sugar/nucleoside kinase (ribokinase family)
LDGFYPEFALECVKLAKRNSIPIIIDCGSWKPQLEEILCFVDIAICSADFYPPNCLTPKQVFDYLKRKNVKEIAISNGRDNIITAKGEEIRIQDIKVIDTLGAGDFLHGAFCYYYLKSGNFIQSLLEASTVATKSCEFEGTRKWLKLI